MMRPSDFQIASVQATVFTPGLTFSQPKILGFALQEYAQIFDGTPISVPFPRDAPAEIPRVTVQSANGHYKLEFALARANLFWFRQSDGDEIDVAQFLDFSAKTLGEYVDFVRGRVGRIAAVLNRFAKEANPAKFLADHFCKERLQAQPFNRPETFEIHAHKRFPLAEKFTVNSWVRCKTGFSGKADARVSGVIVEQDLNTLSEESEKREFSREEITEFYRVVPDEFDLILSLYFPEEG